eukprot:7261412-Pyramimonas_sp.AAC.1
MRLRSGTSDLVWTQRGARGHSVRTRGRSGSAPINVTQRQGPHAQCGGARGTGPSYTQERVPHSHIVPGGTAEG